MSIKRVNSLNIYGSQKFARAGLAVSAGTVKSVITATGGTIVQSGGYKYHTFTSSGNFVVTDGGGIEVLLVAGGAGGGAGGGDSGWGGYTSHTGGGGGAGGVK